MNLFYSMFGGRYSKLASRIEVRVNGCYIDYKDYKPKNPYKRRTYSNLYLADYTKNEKQGQDLQCSPRIETGNDSVLTINLRR